MGRHAQEPPLQNGDAYWVRRVSPIWEATACARLPVHAPQGKPGAGAGGRTLYAELRDGAGSGPIFGARHRPRPRPVRQTAPLPSPGVAGQQTGARLAARRHRHSRHHDLLLATHHPPSPGTTPTSGLSHDVGLLRAAISSRIDNANGAAIGIRKSWLTRSAKPWARTNQASQETFVAATAASQILRQTARSLSRPARQLDLRTHPRNFERPLTTAINEQGRSARRQLSRHRPPAQAALLARQPYGRSRVLLPAVPEPLRSSTPRGWSWAPAAIAIDIGQQLEPLKAHCRPSVGRSGYYASST